MKITILFVVSLFFYQLSSADELDEAIADLQSGTVKYIGEKRWKKLHANSVKKDYVEYQRATAAFYSAQVKWAIIKPKSHGGYPYRSVLLRNNTTSAAVYKVLKADYLKEPTALKAYTLMCPALLYGKEELVAQLKKDIAADKYFSALLKKNLQNWKNYMNNLREQRQ